MHTKLKYAKNKNHKRCTALGFCLSRPFLEILQTGLLQARLAPPPKKPLGSAVADLLQTKCPVVIL